MNIYNLYVYKRYMYICLHILYIYIYISLYLNIYIWVRINNLNCTSYIFKHNFHMYICSYTVFNVNASDAWVIKYRKPTSLNDWNPNSKFAMPNILIICSVSVLSRNARQRRGKFTSKLSYMVDT